MLVGVLLNGADRACRSSRLRARACCARRLIDDLRPRRRAAARARPAGPATARQTLMYLPDERQAHDRHARSWRCASRSSAASRWSLFAIIFFRLWYLQVLSGDKYLAEANDNRVREVKVEAPRGEIVDRNGTVLVDNRTALAVQVHARPASRRRGASARAESAAARRRVLNMRPRARAQDDRARARSCCRSAPSRSSTDVALDTRLLPAGEPDRASRGSTSSGSSCASTRTATIGAHLFGTLGEVTEEQLKESALQRASQLGDRVGQSGIEYEYDRYLRGRNGASRDPGRRARAARRASSSVARSARPASSCGCRSTSACRRRARQALASVRHARRRSSRWTRATARSSGSARNPSFDPNVFAKGDPRPGLQARCRTRTTARRSPTARSRASIRPGRRSS